MIQQSQPMPDIIRHYENIKAALTMALQRGVIGDFETAIAIKQSLDAIKHVINAWEKIKDEPKSTVIDTTTRMNHLTETT